MKKFDTPVLVEVTDLAEGVYASSGAVVIEPTPTPTPPAETINYDLRFEDLDSGSYSVIRFKAFNIDTHMYSGIDIRIDFRPGECNSTLFDVYEVNGSDHSKSVYAQGTSAIIQVRMNQRNTNETIEVAFKSRFNHTFQNEKHPNNSNFGSYDGYAEDGKVMPDKNMHNYASVYVTLIHR